MTKLILDVTTSLDEVG